MSCNNCKLTNQAVEVIGLCDTASIVFDPASTVDRNWTEISIPEVLTIPSMKPDIEEVNKVYINVKILSKRVVETPVAVGENAEGTRLTGRKLVVEGVLCEKIVYTAAFPDQPEHSVRFETPFSAFIILDGTISLDDSFCVDICIEDVFAKVLNCRDVFMNVTLFLRATLAPATPVCA